MQKRSLATFDIDGRNPGLAHGSMRATCLTDAKKSLFCIVPAGDAAELLAAFNRQRLRTRSGVATSCLWLRLPDGSTRGSHLGARRAISIKPGSQTVGHRSGHRISPQTKGKLKDALVVSLFGSAMSAYGTKPTH